MPPEKSNAVSDCTSMANADTATWTRPLASV